MKEPLFYCILFFICINLSCKSQQYTVEDLPQKQLVFGSGGGMSGASDSYILLENGQLFHSNSLTKVTEELPQIDKAKAKEYYKKMADITFAQIQFNHPGNRYYFLEDLTVEGGDRIVWGSTENEIPIECKNLYKELTTHLK